MQIGYKCYSPTLPCRFVSDYVTFLETTSYYSSLSFGSDSPLPCLPWLLSISSCSNLDSPHFVTAPAKLYRYTIIDNRLPLHLLPRLEIPFLIPLTMYSNNQETTHIASIPLFHNRTRHLEVDWHLVQEKVEAELWLPYMFQ